MTANHKHLRWARRQFLTVLAGSCVASSGQAGEKTTRPLKVVDKVVRLRDGRGLGTRRYGDPELGSPVLYFHGAPSARLEPDIFAHLCNKTGIYLIGVDRPGLGLSSYKRNHTVANWPQDISELIDSLRSERSQGSRIDQVGILSMSSGTPFALACAEQLKSDISAVALISPRALGAPGVPYGAKDELLFRFFQRPRLADLQMKLIERSLRRFPRLGIKMFTKKDSPNDQQFASCHYEWMVRCALESVRCGTAGLYRDLLLQCWPWGVCLENIDVPIRARRGACDLLAPIESLSFLAQHIGAGSCSQDFLNVAEQGHLTILMHEARATLAWLRNHDVAAA